MDSIKSLNNKAFELAREYQFGKSLSLSYWAIQYSINNNDNNSLSISYNTLGVTYSRMNYLGKAQNYYEKALELQEDINDKKQIVHIYYNLSRIFYDKKEYENANEMLSTGYEVARSTDNVEYSLMLDWAALDLYKKEKRFDDIISLVEVMKEKIKISDRKSFYTMRKNYLEFILGDTYYHLNDYKKARKYLEKHVNDEAIHSHDLATSYKELAAIYKSLELTKLQKNAYLNYQENLKKKLEGDRNKVQEELLANYSLNKDKLKLDVLEEKNQQKSVIVNNFRVVLIIIGILLLVCIILGSLLIKTIYKKIRSNRLLRMKYHLLEDAKLKAEITSRTKANFFSMMSHELRTPLYAVTGITHLLMEESPKPSQQQYLKSLKFSGDHLLSLVNNILQANKLEDNTITIGESNFSLKANIDNIIKSFDLLIKERENKLIINYDKEIPEFIVGDSLKISQILINLISNAIKFTKGGTIQLHVKKEEETATDVSLYFCVEDTGIGIPKEKQEKVFEMFSQNTVNEEYQGSGLGLSIVKKLLEVYNSTITLESEENKGTRFTFSIRFPKAIKEIAHHVETSIDGVDFSKLRMLVVDDNKINQMLTKKILSTRKITADIVKSGAEAIEAVKTNHYDVILMDIHMPEMDGYQATEAIRIFNKKVPIIAFTAVSLDNSFDKIKDSGMNDMILKPFVAEQLFTLIQKYM